MRGIQANEGPSYPLTPHGREEYLDLAGTAWVIELPLQMQRPFQGWPVWEHGSLGVPLGGRDIEWSILGDDSRYGAW